MIKKVFLSIVVCLFASVFIYDNLNTHSVYYIQQITNRKEPVIMTLLDNMWFVYKPEIDGIKYDLDGTNVIIVEESEAPSVSNGLGYWYSDINKIYHRFDYNFKIDYISDDYDELNINTINQQEIINEMYQFVKPVIDAQPEPIINLQWLYNLFYGNELKRRFI